MSNSFFISIMRWLSPIVSLIYVLSVFEFDLRNFGVANGFEVPSRYHIPQKRMDTSIKWAEEQQESSNSLLPSRSKYDLGLGKNDPVLTNVSVDNKQRSKGPQPKSATRIANLNDKDNINSATYDACRFLVEHEATRAYPSPIDSRKTSTSTKTSQGKNQPNRPFPVTSTTKSRRTISTGVATNRNKQAGICTYSVEQSGTEEEATTTTRCSRYALGVPPKRKQQPVKVQPKRLLEDCLTILDHEFSESTVTEPIAPTNSTIWSNPDTPQLDMNSIWVEMLLHNQIALSQNQS